MSLASSSRIASATSLPVTASLTRRSSLIYSEMNPFARHNSRSSTPSPTGALNPAHLQLILCIETMPCSAETPSSSIASDFITPNDLFFVRNHLPVPHVDPAAFMLTVTGPPPLLLLLLLVILSISGDGIPEPIQLSLDDLKSKVPFCSFKHNLKPLIIYSSSIPLTSLPPSCVAATAGETLEFQQLLPSD